MTGVALTVIEALLIPAGILPIVTAWVLRRYRNADSQSLRDRWHVALVLALLGGIAALIAANALFGLRVGSWLWIPFGVVLLGADVISGKWLLDFWRGRFR